MAGGTRGIGLHEFTLFLHHDPHAKAAQTLASDSFREIVAKLSDGPEGVSRAEVYRKCAACHDPEGMADAGLHEKSLQAVEAGQSTASRGISCETCHGGAKNWLANHYERDLSRSSLVAAGLRDTKNIHIRAKLCASCHVGTAGQDVNHDLLAAGHPPLRFELAAYHRQLTSHDATGKQSHWNDARERIATQDFEVQLWEAGQLAAAKAAFAVLENRAHRAALAAADEGAGGATWPEFAEYDCFSCHQKLRPAEGARKPAAAFPQWGEWNLGLLNLSPATKELSALRTEMRKSFVSSPADVQSFAASTRQLPLRLFDRDANSGQLLTLLEQPSENSNTWDMLCQRYLAQRVVQKTIGDEFQKLEISGQIPGSIRAVFNEERRQVNSNLAAIGSQLAFADSKSEWPKLLTTQDGAAKVESALTASAAKLRKLQRYLEPGR